MDYIEFDQKKAYAFTEKFEADTIKKIKQVFQKKCKANSHYSAEYIKHISNIENIKVDFRRLMKYDIACDFRRIEVDYSYDYTVTYSTGSHVEGTIKFNTSTGKADTSGLHSVTDYDSSDAHMKGSASFYSTEFKKCICHFGNRYFDESFIDNYVEIPVNSKTSAIYKKLYDTTISKEFITKTITLDHLPHHVKEELKESALISYGNPRNFKMHLSDYSIDKCNLIIFPIYEFDVYTEFEGVRHGCNKLNSPDSIIASGPFSDHYKQYSDGVNEVKKKYSVYKWPTGKMYFIGGLFTLVAAIALIVFLATAKGRGNIGFAFMYKPHMIAMIVGLFVITALLAVQWIRSLDLYLSYSDERFYDSKKSVAALLERVTASFKAQKRKSVTIATVCLSFALVVTVVFGLISMSLYKKTDVDNYWYTPEIVKTYEGHENGAHDVLEILSCDDEGNVVAIYTSTYKNMTAEMKYAGKVTRKDYEETVVEFEFVEWIRKPAKGSPEKKMYIYFYNNDYDTVSGSLQLHVVEE